MKNIFHISFFSKKKGVDRHVTDEKKATKSKERLREKNSALTAPGSTGQLKESKKSIFSFFRKNKNENKVPAPEESSTSSVQTSEAKNKPRGYWPFKLFRRKHRISPIVSAEGKSSSKSPTSSNYKPTDEQLLRLFSTCQGQNKKSPNTEPRSSSDNKKEEGILQEVTLSVPEKSSPMPTVGVSCTEDYTTLEMDMDGPFTSSSSSDEDETIEDIDVIRFLKFLNKLVKYPELHQNFPLNPSIFSRFKRNNPTLHKNILKGNFTNPTGFPNIGNTCYMNSTLQSLLCLEGFFRSITCMKKVWSWVPEAQILSKMSEIGDCHTSTDTKAKASLMKSFKKVVSDLAPEFSNWSQNDAHEFLLTVLSQIQCLAPQLQDVASFLGTSYTCPVEANLSFRMENTRTCKTCGDRSVRLEKFTNLSLDMVAGGSVVRMLERYLMEVELEFNCECGGKTSSQKSVFATFPRFLIIHLKRFRFTSYYDLEKVNDPVWIERELVVPSKLGGGCYSLISGISHFGNTEGGHYICDGIHPDKSPYETADPWLTFNDSEVGETTGWTFCMKRQESAYILFYKQQV